ncbi:SCO family protein [Novosphingobium panipatense]
MNAHAMTYRLRCIAPLALALVASLSLSACQQQPTAESPPLEGLPSGAVLACRQGWKDGHLGPVQGRWRIVYFGYTFCPDACPMDVQSLMRGFGRFEKSHPGQAETVQPIFITIDPARDTPEVVGAWTAAFGPRLLGLTGTQEQVDKAAKAFAAYYRKGRKRPAAT